MHALNNGPEYKFAADQRITNLYAFRDAGIPYARNHDASLCYTYGGEHTVDVANIFTDFDAEILNTQTTRVSAGTSMCTDIHPNASFIVSIL